MSNHTPTPWLYHSGAIWKEIKVAGVSSAYRLAFMDRDEPETTPVERDTNAKFIVHACNAHDGLLDALERIAELATAPSLAGWPIARWEIQLNRIRDRAKDAIRKTEQ